MKISIQSLIFVAYLSTTIFTFAYKIYDQLLFTDNTNSHHNNYFQAWQNLFNEPLTKLMIYNLVICLAILIYKSTVYIFYVEIKEMEINNMLEKIGYKLFEFFFFIYIMEAQFGIQVLVTITIVFILFVFHHLANFRAQYLIHTHTMDLMELNYRLLVHFLLLIFIDIQLILNTFLWLFTGLGQSDEAYILFAYYVITIGLTVVEPAASFFLHFYQIYTDTLTPDSDLLKARFNYYINFVRLLIQIVLSSYIAFRFTIAFLLIITIFESVYQLSRISKSYRQINKFTEELKHFPTLDAKAIAQKDDKTCAICYQDVTVEAVVLSKCKHMFHRECLRQWIIKNSNKFCPKCKTPFQNLSKDGSRNVNEDVDRLANRLRQRIIQQQRNREVRQREDPLGFGNDRNQIQNHISQLQKQNLQKYKNLPQSLKIKSTLPLKERKKNLKDIKIRPNYNSKSIYSRIGSVPYGLPTQAIYKRKLKDVLQRQKAVEANEKMIKLLKMEPTKQVLFVPQL